MSVSRPPRAGTGGVRRVSIVVPAKNEAEPIRELLPRIRAAVPEGEIVVVDDGSTDGTGELAAGLGARVVRHPYGMGNGAAIKSGARIADGDILVFMDADGQHDPADISRLMSKLGEGYDMVVGGRIRGSHASTGRRFANAFYNRFASYVTGQKVEDLTSGFRIACADRFREFLYLLPNGFSYPTTSTMAFFRAGYSVAYVPIEAGKRIGKSHIRPIQDGLRFLLIIFKVGTLYSPLKLFAPVSAAFFVTGLSYYLYTYVTAGQFTNMSALMFTTAVLVFLIGLVSEQITQLVYRPTSEGGTANQASKASAEVSRKHMRETGT